ncbi:MAG TPA: thiamine diphosphokinase [Acidimicrobiales bacterium]|nr:thiamine diphosphokinase [Actinomycetota bacterium]HJL89794.1 thiamine diphosphokinase [Acidimicrobiales bacterium]
MREHHALIITGGPTPVATADLPPAEFVVAADRGADNAASLGLVPDLLVGDLDSVSTETLTSIEEAGVQIERHPTDKDQTDLELALAAATNHGATSVTIVATATGRPDHAMANLLTAAAERWAGLEIDLLVDSSRAWVVRSRLDLKVPVGSLVSLMAVGGRVTGVTSSGLRWPLSDSSLKPGVGRGLSNEVTAMHATVEVATGTLLVVCP